jgi:hypothetical protein
VVGIKEFPNLIFNGKFRGPSPLCGGPRTPPRRRLTGERAEQRPRAWNLTAVEEKGEGTAVRLTGCKRGRQRDGHGRATVGNNRRRRCSVGWTLRTRERANEGGVSVVMAEGCSSPFHNGRGGARRGEGGRNGRR